MKDESNNQENLNNTNDQNDKPEDTNSFISLNPDFGLKIVEEYHKKAAKSWEKFQILAALKAAAQHGFGKNHDQDYLDYIHLLLKGKLLLKLTQADRSELIKIAIESSTNDFKNKMLNEIKQNKNKHFSKSFF